VNFCLYQCDQEGREEGGYGVYDIPNFGRLNYCGLAGLVPLLNRMRPANDLGHPLAANLRAGNWLMEYTANRLAQRLATKPLAAWLQAAFGQVAQLPRYLVPRYFDTVLMAAYAAIYRRSLALLGPFVAGGSEFVQRLAQGTVIHLAAVASARLPPLSAALLGDGGENVLPPTLAAGLPHFCTGYMRSWGRDTFIALRGLLLTTGRYREARDIILGYAGCLRSGKIFKSSN
jgi:glycogen debranching enzyme